MDFTRGGKSRKAEETIFRLLATWFTTSQVEW